MWKFAITVSLALCSCAGIAPPAAKGSVDHIVLIWLKRPDNIEDHLAIRRASDELREIPGIRFLDTGTPLASDRPIVDDSFDIGVTMRFDSAAALRAYENHPLHVRNATAVLKPLSRQIVIYDIKR